jgi:hypothetical protein
MRLGTTPRVVLENGKRLDGPITGLDAVPVQLGPQTLPVNLGKASELTITPAAEHVSCTLIVSQGGKEIVQHSQDLTDRALIKNPGFETELDGWIPVTHNAPARFEIDTEVSREGWQSLRLTVSQPTDAGCTQEVLLKPGAWYRFSGWVRTRGLKPQGAPHFGTFYIHPRGSSNVIAKGDNHGGDTDWTEVQITFQAPPDGAINFAVVGFGFGPGTGTAWFDNLKLVEVSDVPRTKVARWADPGLEVTDGLELWLDPARLNAARQAHGLEALESGDRLLTWYDASGHGRDVRQSAPASRPRLVQVGKDWLVRFNGIDNHLRRTGMNRSLGGITVFAVAAPRENPGGFRGFLAINQTGGADFQTGLNLDQGPNPTAQFEVLSAEGRGFSGFHNLLDRPSPFRTLHLLEVVADPGRRMVQLVLDGRPGGVRPCAPGPISFDEVTVGARYPGQAGLWFPGDIAEILVYAWPLTDAETRSIRQYLHRKYARLPTTKTGLAR